MNREGAIGLFFLKGNLKKLNNKAKDTINHAK